MDGRISKLGISLFLVAVLVVAIIFPVTSQAAAKSTTYTVLIEKESPSVTYISIGGGAPSPQVADSGGITFKMVVEAKAKTEKVKSTKQKVTYYPVTILAKSFKAPTSRMPMPGGDYALTTEVMKKDAKGKLYTTAGCDVDVINTGGKKVVSKIGDGTADPAGSMIVPNWTVFTTSTMETTKKVFLQQPITCTFTTGKCSIVVKGTKSRLEGKSLPNDDTTGKLSKPLAGAPVDLKTGTGTLVGSTTILNTKNKQLGKMDYLHAQIFVMKITQ